jgi:hypothetical protein
VQPLAKALRELGVTPWVDQFELAIGDSLHRKIDAGIAGSKFGVVVLSPSFFANNYTRRELDGLVSMEVEDPSRQILPYQVAGLVQAQPAFRARSNASSATRPMNC